MPQDTENFEMAAADHSAILRCGLCNKPFAKRKSPDLTQHPLNIRNGALDNDSAGTMR